MKNKFLLYLLLAFALLLQVQAGFAQKKTILVTPGGKPLGGPGAAFMLAGPEIVETPVAGNVTVTGTSQEGQQLTVTYNYSDAQNDPEGATTFQWYRADDASGTGKAAISGATAGTYTLDAADQGKYVTAGVTPVALSGPSPGPEALADYAGPVTGTFACGGTITINHSTSDGVSPLTTTITYNTVQSSITGASKCWTTQNLGASQEASSPMDEADAAAGWYWTFGNKQGCAWNSGGSSLTPSLPTANLTTDWAAAEDPCSVLGAGWRLPTGAEWQSLVDDYWYWDFSAGAGDSTYDPWFGYVYSPYPIYDRDGLKFHMAGYIPHNVNTLYGRGTFGTYLGSSLNSGNSGGLVIDDGNPDYNTAGTSAYSVRCLKD